MSCFVDAFMHSLHPFRPAKLKAYQDEMAAKNGELQPGERRVSGRRRDDQVRVCAVLLSARSNMSLALSDLFFSFMMNAKRLS